INRLKDFVIPRKLGLVMGPNVPIRFGSGLVRCPDIAFFRSGQRPARPRKYRFLETVPLLVVEIIRDRTAPAETRLKMRDYLRRGVHRVWIINPLKKTVRVFSGRDSMRLLRGEAVLNDEENFPGLSLPLKEIFAIL